VHPRSPPLSLASSARKPTSCPCAPSRPVSSRHGHTRERHARERQATDASLSQTQVSRRRGPFALAYTAIRSHTHTLTTCAHTLTVRTPSESLRSPCTPSPAHRQTPCS